MARDRSCPKSNENGQSELAAPEYPEEELRGVMHRFRVSAVEAPTWCDWDRSMSVWRQRCLAMLPVMMATPDAHIALMSRLKAAKDKDHQPTSFGWELDHRALLDDVIAQLMEHARPGQTPHAFALELMAEFERYRRHPVILDLCTGGWLPKPPPRPGSEIKPRDPVDEAERMRRADALAEEITAPQPDASPGVHDWHARAAGEADQ